MEDNGLMTGLCEEDMISSLDTLREMARRLGATIEVLRDREVETDDGIKTVAEILVRKAISLFKNLIIVSSIVC